ncbi:MAG TPA: hypothetical protein VN495_02785 [Candidatus Paceibacterota bacterium]|nr:hypothetical protein [Candidatus Paceibacterota bacterium]
MQRLPGATDSAHLVFTNGTQHLLQLYRTRFDPACKPEEDQGAILYWHGTMPTLSKLNRDYRRLIGRFCELDPTRKATYVTGTGIDLWFGEGPSGYNLPEKLSGKIRCSIDGDGDLARREIASVLRRREKDWVSAFIGTHERHVFLQAGRGPESEISFWVAAGIRVWPLRELADLIESTSPKAYVHDDENQARLPGEQRFDAWPLSRAELEASLKMIQELWSESPHAEIAA